MLCVISAEETAKLNYGNGSQFAEIFHVIADAADRKQIVNIVIEGPHCGCGLFYFLEHIFRKTNLWVIPDLHIKVTVSVVLNEVKQASVDGHIILARIILSDMVSRIIQRGVLEKPSPAELPEIIFGSAFVNPEGQFLHRILCQRIDKFMLPGEIKLIPNSQVSAFQKIVRAHLSVLIFLLRCFNVARCIQSLKVFVTLIFRIPGELSKLADAVATDGQSIEQCVVAFGRTELLPKIYERLRCEI